MGVGACIAITQAAANKDRTGFQLHILIILVGPLIRPNGTQQAVADDPKTKQAGHEKQPIEQVVV